MKKQTEGHPHRINKLANNTTTIQQPFIRDNPGELVSELSQTLTQYIAFTVLKFLTSTPNLPSQSTSKV